MNKKLEVLIIGGGMITYDLLLPSIYHLQRTGVVGNISVCALTCGPLKVLAESEEFAQAFPGQSFDAYPSLLCGEDQHNPDLFRERIAALPPRQIVVVAMPDHLHYEVVKFALEHDQHVLCVKPLVLKYSQDIEIEKIALERGLFVGVEYHKRFDRRNLVAKRSYELGHFGEFVMGDAKLMEPYFYRHSNFQNWFTYDKTDPFVYVGCHYVDLVYFITGLKPVEVSVKGVKSKFPNGNEAFMWATGRVVFENGAILNVSNGLGYPDEGAGGNEQSLTMFFEGNGKTGFLKHDDQFRGVTHSFLEPIGLGGTYHNYVNPDFYKLVSWEGVGYKPIGYGFDSVAASINTMASLEDTVSGLSDADSLAKRREIIKEIDAKGIIATPANSYINELVVEAARESIMNDGINVKIKEQ